MTTVRCPNCEATYTLDAAKLGAGRKLKCARCQTVWVATAEPVADAAKPEVAAEPAAGAKIDAMAAEAVPAAQVPVSEDVPPPDVIQRTPNVEALTNVGGWQQWLRGENIWRTGAVVVLALGVLAGAGTVWWRMRLHAEPKTEAAKVEAVTAPHEPQLVDPPAGVVLHRVRGDVSKIDGEQGGVALTVRGLLANTTSATVTVPALQLELLGDDGKVADMWPVSGVSGTLPPQDEQAWTVSLTAPDMSSIKGWRIVFVK